MNAVPTAVLQGAVTATDFEGETRTHLKREVVAQKMLHKEVLPVNRLVLLAPATIHYAQRPEVSIAMRHFLRWQVFF